MQKCRRQRRSELKSRRNFKRSIKISLRRSTRRMPIMRKLSGNYSIRRPSKGQILKSNLIKKSIELSKIRGKF